MRQGEVGSDGEISQPPVPTAPAGWVTRLLGFADETQARKFASTVSAHVRGLSCHVDMGNLDGITIAFDYDAALRDLDMGFETPQRLSRSKGEAVGVAMTTSVMRDGQAKSHMVFSAPHILPLLDQAHEHYAGALHILAHEAAHVEVASRLHAAFPGELISGCFPSLYASHRRSAVLACWEEYEVSRLCAGFGEDPTNGYETIFVDRLAAVDDSVHVAIVACRESRDWDALLLGAFTIFANLFRAASYVLGSLSGNGRQVSELTRLAAALEDHWFQPYVEELASACETVSTEYGSWTDWSQFDAIGLVIEQAIEQAGIEISDMGGGRHFVRLI